MKEFWREDNYGKRYLERQFAWLPVYIQGSLGWLSFYWVATLKRADGGPDLETCYWNDPRKG